MELGLSHLRREYFQDGVTERAPLGVSRNAFLEKEAIELQRVNKSIHFLDYPEISIAKIYLLQLSFFHISMTGQFLF